MYNKLTKLLGSCPKYRDENSLYTLINHTKLIGLKIFKILFKGIKIKYYSRKLFASTL
jgi:hypothetical protein